MSFDDQGIDSRKMCFEQGKACIYMSDDGKESITEEPNGVVERYVTADKLYARRWPRRPLPEGRSGVLRIPLYP